MHVDVGGCETYPGHGSSGAASRPGAAVRRGGPAADCAASFRTPIGTPCFPLEDRLLSRLQWEIQSLWRVVHSSHVEINHWSIFKWGINMH